MEMVRRERSRHQQNPSCTLNPLPTAHAIPLPPGQPALAPGAKPFASADASRLRSHLLDPTMCETSTVCHRGRGGPVFPCSDVFTDTSCLKWHTNFCGDSVPGFTSRHGWSTWSSRFGIVTFQSFQQRACFSLSSFQQSFSVCSEALSMLVRVCLFFIRDAP